MAAEYRHNHYVPVWHQKRFLRPGQKDQELQYLDLNPGSFVDGRCVRHAKRAVRRQGFRFCFAQDDLYTVAFGAEESTRIEQYFFGSIDSYGRYAVEYSTNFEHPPSNPGDALTQLILYMTTQKLRTPKGLGWLSDQVRSRDKNLILKALVDLRQLYSAIWAECIWQIADASQSETKFIISDHPVTVYNRRCGPKSQWCRGYDDPDIRFRGTHTIFPLSLDKILILTNLSWVRNPCLRGDVVEPLLRKARVLELNQNYPEQTALIEKIHEKDGTDIYVAQYNATRDEKKDEHDFSAVWSTEVVTPRLGTLAYGQQPTEW